MTELNKKRLRQLQHSDHWEAFVIYYGEIMDKINSEEVIGNNEFETLRNVFVKEGKKKGIRELFADLDKILVEE